MNPDQLNRRAITDDDAEEGRRIYDDPAVHVTAHSTLGIGARAVNRLLWSLWFMLLPLLWLSSDWIGLLIMSQALFVAAKLVQPVPENAGSTASLIHSVLTMQEGEDCA
jgi:hypothetical protein